LRVHESDALAGTNCTVSELDCADSEPLGAGVDGAAGRLALAGDAARTAHAMSLRPGRFTLRRLARRILRRLERERLARWRRERRRLQQNAAVAARATP
jgi:hypothetical protein